MILRFFHDSGLALLLMFLLAVGMTLFIELAR